MKPLAFFFIAVAAWGQDATFVVAAVKPSAGLRDGSSIRNNPGRFQATNTTLAKLIQFALPAQAFQLVGGPAWIREARFDIAASTGQSDDDVKSQSERIARIRSRVRHLLEDRFQLQLREEQREMPVYALETEKSGIRMKAAEVLGNVNSNSGAAGATLNGKGLTMTRLCEVLSSIVERPVNDETGLAGAYDVELKYSQDDAPAETALAFPSIFTALKEQLGLRLTGKKGAAQVWVVVRAEKPGDN
jgi:uncharacterized protein (TIGR03435 family)